ncbi:hypothetical protein bsdtw1_00903 [Clostridium fungisolvens]|uniref:Uncharacterized protein n=1 Tax=Clostridium fungisolvens TaxID=1604897 RepID=A0A6V8SDC8_9CLOT|nr:hypothetical protein bsdtw1_00903 [Clostridium fungisolvens]
MRTDLRHNLSKRIKKEEYVACKILLIRSEKADAQKNPLKKITLANFS